MDLTQNEKQISILLFNYRGSTGPLLTKGFYKSLSVTKSNEKYIYGILANLKKKGLVVAAPISYKDRKTNLYYLTSKGLEMVKAILDIEVGQNGSGLLPHNKNTVYWDIPYEFYKPPFKQTDHFLLSQEVFLRLEIVANEEDILYCTSHYSPIHYRAAGENQKLRPDATLFLNNKRYGIEIDTSSEWRKQLIDKFKRYKDNYDFCKQNPGHPEAKPVHSIIFIMKEDLQRGAYKRRWESIAAAFYEVFGVEFEQINLILIPLHDVRTVLNFEVDRKYYTDEFKKQMRNNKLEDDYVEGYFELLGCNCLSDGESYTPLITFINLPFETRTLSDILKALDLKNKFKNHPKIKVNGEINELQSCCIIQGSLNDKPYQFRSHLLWDIPQDQIMKINAAYRAEVQQSTIVLEEGEI